MRETWTFHTAGELLFGRRASRQLGEVLRRIGCKRALLVTDAVLEKAGLVEHVSATVREGGIDIHVFSGGEPEPSFRAAEACVSKARQAEPDAVIGLGGGSNMDLAKITATVLTHGGMPRDYVGEDRVPG